MIVAAIDVGTNSVRMLLLSEREELQRTLEITRLGKGVDSSRTLQPESIDRTIKAIERFVEDARSAGADRIVIAATSAVRDANNRDAFIDSVRDRTGVDVRVLDGKEEAALSFRGAAGSFDPSIEKVVIDIGGGSTELIVGSSDVRASISIDCGSVRLTERHVQNDPPLNKELEAVRSDARELLQAGSSGILSSIGGSAPMVIGVAGTFTTLAGFALRLDRYDRDRTHAYELTAPMIRSCRERLSNMTVAEKARNPIITPGRADVIVTGAIIAEEALSILEADLVVISETDILDGLAATL
ncbi:MAG: Ppx/GppA phosphatase family protein [Actinomycetota bacterium]